jgi:hypothetical protein
MTGQLLFAVALALSWLNSAMHVVFASRPLYHPRPLAPVPLGPRWVRLVLLAGTLVFAGLLAWWLRGPVPEAAAATILVVLVLLRRWETAQWPQGEVVRLGKYVPAAACLSGWLLLQLIGHFLGWEEAAREAAGWEAAAGVIAAQYGMAGLAKLRETGLGWVGWQHQALLIAERAYSGPRVLRLLRQQVARLPAVCAVIGVVGLGLELGGLLYIVPQLRVGIAALVLLLYFNIALLLGYLEPEWWLVIVAVTWLSTAA